MPKTTLSFYLHIIAVVLIVMLITSWAGKSVESTNEQKISVFSRVMKTKTIRCGYGTWPPIVSKDPNTGKVSGVMYDLMEEIGKGLNVKIEWTEEIAWSEFATALESDRFDMFCVPMAAVPQRVSHGYFTAPFAFIESYAYTRADDQRFDHNLDSINAENVTISVIEGELTSALARSGFPKAKLLEITAQQGLVQAVLNVTTGKADVVFIDTVTAHEFMKNNPGKLRKIPADYPIGVFGVSMIAKLEQDQRFLWLIDSSIRHLLNTRFIDGVLKKYDIGTDQFLHVAKPYQPVVNP